LKLNKYRIGIDVGGTFTDLSFYAEKTGEIEYLKIPSTPENPSRASIDGIKQVLSKNEISPRALSYIAHGSTVATNAILELKGAKTGLITTRGFRDLLEIGRQKRPDLFDLFADKPPCLIPRHLRKEVRERVTHDGKVIEALNKDDLIGVVQEFIKKNVEACAICFLYSYAYPDHETMVRQEIEKENSLFVSTSSDVLPEFREYERTSTTVLNAYLGPVMKYHLGSFMKELNRMSISINPYVNQSNGGLASIESAKRYPVQTALSGPSGGVIGANIIASLCGIKNIISFDMGGTSTDVSLVENSAPRITTDRDICGYPAKIPMLDIHAIGAGGGSIAYIDAGGGLKVGPESMGADPGPACYMRGGALPTVTDANVILGRINPEYLLNGAMKIDLDASENAIRENISQKTGLDEIDAAEGIVTIINANMARAVRKVSVERGYSLSNFTLVAFGGMGPLHGPFLAKELSIPSVLVPLEPGILSSLGLLLTDMRRDFVKTNIMVMENELKKEIRETLQELEQKANAWLDSESVSQNKRIINRSIDMRYEGQNYEIRVDLQKGVIDLRRVTEDFYAEHKKTYGHFFKDAPIQLVNFRITAYGIVQKPRMKRFPSGDKSPERALINKRNVYFDNKFIACPIYSRSKLLPGDLIEGPAVIEQLSSTTVILPGQDGEVDPYLNIMIRST
jgi:N-methylhydantoinase A